MREDIFEELTALATHYPRVVRNPEEQSKWMASYLDALGKFPIEAVRLGCRSWLHGEGRKFPLVGEIIASCRQHVIAKPESHSGPWEPLDDDAYRALSLREKVRYHKIAANEAGRAAGPMWKNGAPATADQLGEKWARNTKIKANHLAEVTQLTKALELYQEKGDDYDEPFRG